MTFTVPSVPAFPTLRAKGFVTRHILTSSQIEKVYSGGSSFYPAWSVPQYQFEIPVASLRSDISEWQNFEGFVKLAKVSAGGLFQFAFADDGVATAQSFGVGDGSTLTFQLLRTLGGFVEPIYCPATITNISANGSTVDPSHYDVSNKGVVSFKGGYTPASGAVLTWSGTYNWYCRFDADDDQLTKFGNVFWSIDKITFTTVKMRTA